MPDTSVGRRLRSRARTSATVARLLVHYAVYGLLKRVVPVRTLARMAWRPPRPSAAFPPASVVVAPIIKLASLVGAGRGDCVQLALVCYRELSRAGHEPVLVVGLAAEGGPKTPRGHAWVELEGRPVVEPAESLAPFVPAFGFGPGGQAVAIERG